MSNLARITQKIFAADAGSDEIIEFGSKAAGTPVPTTDAADIQTTEYDEGWLAATLAGARFLPTYQDMNGLFFLLSQQIAYILQKGIPEYDAGTDYYTTNIVKKSGTTQLYASLTNANTGNPLTDVVNWQLLGDLANIPDVVNTANPTASTLVRRDTNANFAANSVVQSIASTATAAGTTTLVVASTATQRFTGSTTQTCVLPDATTLRNGQVYNILNDSTGVVTINFNGGSLAALLSPGQSCKLFLASNGSSAGTWSVKILGVAVYDSGQQTITSSGGLSLSHGLGKIPDIVKYYLVCTTNDIGWVAGETLEVYPHIVSNSSQENIACESNLTSSQILLYFGANTSFGTTLNKGTRVGALITSSSWRLVVRAYSFT